MAGFRHLVVPAATGEIMPVLPAGIIRDSTDLRAGFKRAGIGITTEMV
jgi:hypothetical protein